MCDWEWSHRGGRKSGKCVSPGGFYYASKAINAACRYKALRMQSLSR